MGDGRDILDTADPSELRAFPDQERIYGAVGGEHDSEFASLRARIEQTKFFAPLLATAATPGLKPGTIISGHRRAAVARALGMRVPVQWVTYPSPLEARVAFLALNESREKNEWVKTQEAEAWREIESELAKRRQKDHGGTAPGKITSGTSSPSDPGRTRDAVAARLGESGKTTDLRFKLAEKAREQSPANPSASPVARDLAANKPVKTVAREHGVIKPDAKRDRRAEVLALAQRLLHATTRAALDAARGEAGRMSPALDAREAEEIDAAYFASTHRLAAKPAPAPSPVAAPRAPLPPLPDVMAPMAGMRWARELGAAVDGFLAAWDALLAKRPSAPEAIEATESEAARVLDAILNELPEGAREGAAPKLAVIKGGK